MPENQPPMPAPAVLRFRDLHESGCFVIPNPWDRGSARALEAFGFQALATTSSGFAFTRAKPDRIAALAVDEVLEHLRDLAAATSLPVNADFQDGYAETVDELAANVECCARTGVAGLSVEDATGVPDAPLFERDVAVERVRAARTAIDATDSGVLLTARCEAWLVGHPDARSLAVERLVLFAEAGADCLFAPGVFDPEAIAEIVRAVAPKTGQRPRVPPGRRAHGRAASRSRRASHLRRLGSRARCLGRVSAGGAGYRGNGSLRRALERGPVPRARAALRWARVRGLPGRLRA